MEEKCLNATNGTPTLGVSSLSWITIVAFLGDRVLIHVRGRYIADSPAKLPLPPVFVNYIKYRYDVAFLKAKLTSRASLNVVKDSVRKKEIGK